MITHSDIFAPPASVRWKRKSASSSGNSFSLANDRRIRQMVSSQNASRFISNNEGYSNDTTRVSKGEDLKEVSSQLGFLRKNYDVNKTINSIRLRNLGVKSFDLHIVQENVKATSFRIEESREKVKFLESEIAKIWKLQENSTLDTFTCKHMLERTQASHLRLDMRSLELNKVLKNNQHVLNQETQMKRRVREARIQTKVAVTNLEKFIERETGEKIEELEGIEKDVQKKKDSNKRREERFRRQIEILEAAADEDRNMRAMQLREGLLLHMFWYFMLQKRLIHDMNKFKKLEDAFDDVKTATGMHETSEIITKLLTREAGYQEILENVSYTKVKIRKLSRKNKEIEEKLSLISIVKTENINPARDLELEVSKKLKEIEIDNERYRKILSVYKKLTSWCGKMNLAIDENSGSTIKVLKIPLADNCNVLNEILLLKQKVSMHLSVFKSKMSADSQRTRPATSTWPRSSFPKVRSAFKGTRPEQINELELIQSLIDKGEASSSSIKLKKTSKQFIS